ncbi:MAG: 3-hydroxyacyl-CoA dehydrogenase NAD-binding domain-containing protein [Thermodesulfobacteriota bacterium]
MKENMDRVVIAGAGVMGYGMAQNFAQEGFKVSLVDISQQALDRALRFMKSSIQTTIDEGLVKDTLDEVLARITLTTSLEEGAKDADLAIEAIFEQVQAKKDLFARLDEVCPPNAILASNTSFLNIFDFVETSRPDKVLITHWYAPPHLVPLVDVVGGPRTSPESVEAVAQVLRRIGKRPVVMKKYISGYAVNRIQHALNREVNFLIDSGYIAPEELDEAVKVGLAFRMMVVGVVQRYDFGGISMRTRHPPGFQEVPLDYEYKTLKKLIERGRLGVKSGRGFYDYSGRNEEEVYRERDIRLIEMARTLRKLEERGPIGKSYEDDHD